MDGCQNPAIIQLLLLLLLQMGSLSRAFSWGLGVGGGAVNWTLCLVLAFSRLVEDIQFGQLAGVKGLVHGCGIRPNELG